MRRFGSAGLVVAALAPLASGLVALPATAAAAATAAADTFVKLQSVSASASDDAWTVGTRSLVGGPTLGLTRHWDGDAWTTVPSAHPGEDSFLWGVTDISPTDAWAVGEWLGGAEIVPFAEHWDGTAWTVVTLHGAPGLGKLNAVSANGPDDVWMVGTAGTGPSQTPRTFIEHWDGTAIHRVKAGRVLHARSSELTGVTALAADDVWAVGAHGRQGQLDLPLLEHFDGTAWSVVNSDLTRKARGYLHGIDGAATTDVWAVGWEALEGHPSYTALAEHWDGTSWTHTATVTPGYASFLNSVSAVSDDDAWAVGYQLHDGRLFHTRPLIEHWDGTSWSVVDAPARPQAHSALASVSMDGASDGFAVGDSRFGDHIAPYLLHFDGTGWSR